MRGAHYFPGALLVELVGYPPFTHRLPDAAATRLATALQVVLTWMLCRRPITAGITLCLLPRVTWMGTEGRSYVLAGLLPLATTASFLCLALLVVANEITVACTMWSSRRRSDLGRSAFLRSAAG
jgi:mannosyltransferase